jgi:DNA-binding GntR family transcriptional regulator
LACSDDRQWQGLLTVLGRLSEAAVAARLLDLETRLRRWYQTPSPLGHQAFSWVAPSGPQPPAPVSPQGGSGRDPVPDRSLADDIILTIRQGLSDGIFASNDEISDRSFSRRLGVSRGRVQRALQSLAEDGLVTATTGTAVVVRLPTVADVMETYTARRALGAITVRAASRWAPEQRATVEHLLDEIRRCAEHHDVARAQQADLDFQNALFKASGLARIPSMLESLSKQTLMFISVIGLRYAYSPTRIVELDTAIFEGVRDKDPEKATRGWQNKIDEGARYMIDQIDLLTRASQRAPDE